MIIMLTALQAAVIAAPPAPPAPPQIYLTPISPPPGQSNRNGVPTMPAPKRSRIGVVVRAGNLPLWDGALWVASRGVSVWRQSVQEPLPEQCGPRPWSNDQNEISVQLSPVIDDANASRIAVTVRWVRSGDEVCGGTRSVELRQTIAVPPSGVAVVRGDAGLVVELRQR
ncbi:hypothetical protein ACU5AX_02505 [Sphingomonas sp. XXL09]|uniref:hypothetical protein n=1 Tax=Sphingomonas sp. XXL09 TaxID=3457787 RepID=UPI00406BB121